MSENAAPDILALALVGRLCPRTVRRALTAPGSVRPSSLARLREAAKQLDIALPETLLLGTAPEVK